MFEVSELPIPNEVAVRDGPIVLVLVGRVEFQDDSL